MNWETQQKTKTNVSQITEVLGLDLNEIKINVNTMLWVYFLEEKRRKKEEKGEKRRREKRKREERGTEAKTKGFFRI